MWKVDGDKAYPFRHQRTNFFPPRAPPLSIPPLLTPDRIPLETCYEDSVEDEDEDEDAEIPIIFHSPLIGTPTNIPYASASAPEPSPPPPFNFDMEPPPTPSSAVPANLTNLLQDVLRIMNTIMDSRAAVVEEDAILQELTELVVIMQEEAEMLVEVSDLVEEYCGEVEIEIEVREMEEWCFELGIGRNGEGLHKEGEVKRLGHEREDSGVGLDDDEMFGGREERGGEFMDDRSLEEMKAPSRLIEPANDALNDMGLKTMQPLPKEIGRASGQALTVLITPPPKPTPKDTRFRKKPNARRKEESLSGKRPPTTKKKEKEKRVPPPFRDSGLGLQSPSPSRGSPIPRTPRWI